MLDALHEKSMTQKELAVSMGVSPQQVSKILKGTENLTLETISKLERALGVIILTVESHSKTFELDKADALQVSVSHFIETAQPRPGAFPQRLL
nr:helix-turn-helix transcriptional regulator [Prosthecochloris sp. CIB 2401]